jgi:arylsulfatase A-like enzyme
MSAMVEEGKHRVRTLFELTFISALIGGCFGLIDIARDFSLFSGLPMTSELIIIAAAWYAGAAMGSIFAMAFAAVMFVYGHTFGEGRASAVWPGTASMAICFWLTLLPKEAETGSYWTHVLTVFALVFIFGLFGLIVRRYRVVRAAVFWGVINLVLLCWLLLRVTQLGPVKHGTWPVGALFVFVPLAVATVPFFFSSSRLYRWSVVSVAALMMFLLALTWFRPLSWNPQSVPGAANKTNVLLITVDTLRTDYLGCYGNERVRTPSIDRLSRQSVLFENAISPIPITNPSHTSILTGLYPGNHGVAVNGPMDFESDVLTMPRLLSKQGYKTAAFISGYTLKRDVCRLKEEFELYNDDFSNHWFLPEISATRGFSSKLLSLPLSMHPSSRVYGYERRADRTVDDAKEWLRRNTHGPFFLWLHLFDPHSPYTPPAPYNKMYDGKYTGKVKGDFHVFSFRERLDIAQNTNDLNHLKALYAGEVSYVDEQIGRLLAELDDLHLSERTLIILTADHGESLTEHNSYFGHGACLYDVDLKVPLIFRFPDGKGAGTRHAGIVQLVDILPTILGYLGIPIPARSDGVSLLSPMEASTDLNRPSVAVSVILEGHLQHGRSLLSLRTTQYKYIRVSPSIVDRIFIPGREELYDLVADPQETRNMFDVKPDVLKRYRSLAAGFWNAWFLAPKKNTGSQRLSKSAIEKLRALGYIQ